MYPGKAVHTWWVSVAVSMVIALAAFALASLGEGRGILTGSDLAHSSDNLLRLHVIAHSDAPADQNAKLKVRDAILREMAGWQHPTDRGQLESWVTERQDVLVQAAKRALAQLGHEREVRVETGAFPFPQKEWDGGILPAGTYRAIRVVIGDGAGQNWWCVLFPPLCFVEESGDPVSGSVAHAQEATDEAPSTADAGSQPQVDGEWSPAEVTWRLRLWESISESAIVGRVKDLVDTSLEASKKLSP